MLVSLTLATTFSICVFATQDDPAALLPPETLVYFGTGSVQVRSEVSRQTAMNKILDEAEVRAFLHEPTLAAEHVLQVLLKQGSAILHPFVGTIWGLSDTDELEIDLDVARGVRAPPVGKLFFALTHVIVSKLNDENVPEIGLVAGIELLDEAQIKLLQGLWGQLPWPEEQASHQGVRYSVRRSPEGLTAALVLLGQLAIISTSERTLQGIIDRHESLGETSSLQEAGDYREMLEAADGLPKGAYSYMVRVGALLRLAREALPMMVQAGNENEVTSRIEALLDKVGLEAVGVIGGVSKVVPDGRIDITNRMTIDPHAKGLIARAYAPGAPLDPTILGEFPGDCLSASAGHLGTLLVDAYDVCVGLLRDLNPDGIMDVETGLARFMSEGDLREDILANLHGQLLTFSEPGEGLMGTPESMLKVGVKDEKRFVDAVRELLGRLETESGMQITLKETEHDTVSFYEIDLSSTPLGMALQPAFAARNGQIIASNSARRLREYLNNEAGTAIDLSQDVAVDTFVREVASGGSLQSVGFSDNAGNFSTLYGQVVAGAQMAASALGNLPVDLSKLPPESVITRHLRDTYTATSVTEGGVHTRKTLAQFQLMDFVPIMLIGGLVALGEARDIRPEAVALDIDPGVRVQSDLRELKASITVYKISNGEYPESLEDLLRPLPDFPEGAYTQGQLPVDAWGNSYLYAIEMHPDKNRLWPKIWSAGANGIDESGFGDDVVKF